MKSKTIVFYLISLILTAVFFIWFLSNDIFVGDDISEIVNLSQNTAKYNIDGLYTSVMTKLFCVKLPLFLNIHPHQFSMTAGAFVRGFNIAVLCGVISLFLFIGRNKKFYLGLGTLFSAFYFCHQIWLLCLTISWISLILKQRVHLFFWPNTPTISDRFFLLFWGLDLFMLLQTVL